MKISKKLIFDYINGEDIDNIEELENNYQFMEEVIRLTNDKNMYNMCSEKVKNNGEFVKFVIEKFKNDFNFIINVSEDYLKGKDENNDVSALEIIFIVGKLLNNYNNLDGKQFDVSLKYNLIRSTFLSSEKLKRQLEINNEEDLFWKEEFGLGFRINQYEYYHTSNIIMNEIADSYIYDIFYDNPDIKLENLIHDRFKNVEDLKKYGIKNYIINYIRCYDTNLADYIECHINLIKSVEEDINRIVLNFDKYNENLNKRKEIIFYNDAYDILEKYNATNPLDEYLTIIDRMKIKGLPKFELENEICDLVDSNNIEDYKILKLLINLAKEVYLSSSDDFNEINEKELIINNKANILEFKPKSKKNKIKKHIPNNNED